MIGLLTSLSLSAAAASIVTQVVPPDTDQSAIVVVGKRNAEQEMKEFVRALTPTPGGGQLARFEQNICPAAIGLSPVQREAVVARMRRLAQEIGLRVSGANCVPNVLVMVTQDKKTLMRALRERHSHYFGNLPVKTIRSLERQPGPAVAWQIRGFPVNADGKEVTYDEAQGWYVNRTSIPQTRLAAGTRPQTDGAVVVVERGSLNGVTVTQLADYAAMRAYAGADPLRLGQSTQSVLRVLHAPVGSEVPLSVTETDLAFLRAYHAAPRNQSTSSQRSAIARSIAEQAERAESQ